MKRCSQCQAEMDADEAVCSRCGYREKVTEPKSALDYLNRGIDLSNRGDLDRAIADFTEALRLDPTLAGAQRRLQSAFSSLGAAPLAGRQLDKAIAAYTEAIRVFPTPVDYNYRAVAFSQKGAV